MKENFIKQIESKLTTLKAEAAEKAVSPATMKKNIGEVKRFIETSIDLSGKMGFPFTDEEAKTYFNEINELMEPYAINVVSPKSFRVNKAFVSTCAVGITVVVGGSYILSMAGCGGDKTAINEVVLSTEKVVENEIPEVNVPTAMDVKYKEMADEIVVSMDDAISKGFEVTAENKSNMSHMYVEYYMLNQIDTLTDEEWANIFQNSSTTARDIMNSKESLEWIDEQRVTVADKDMILNYSYMFEGADLKLLTDASELLDKLKTTTGKEKAEAETNFKKYVIENLGSQNARMQYSERALDTFRAVYFDAFDTLTGGKAIDDELEHAINSTITCSLGEINLDVEDKTIKSLQSDYETYLLEKVEVRLENGWEYVNNHEVNPYNDINEISEYVSENINLALYVELPDYEQTLTEMLAPKGSSEKAKDDSGVSNGKGGNISQEQFDQYGVDSSSPNAKKELEQKVEEETKKQEDESTRVTDENGNTIQGTAQDNINGFTEAYNAAMNGQSKPAYTGNQSYDAGIDSGWAQGIADLEALNNSIQNNTETEFVTVENGETIVEESEIQEEGYTDSNSGNVESSETPSDEDRFIEEETTFVPIAQRIEELNAFKASLEKYIITDVKDLSIDSGNSKQFTV